MLRLSVSLTAIAVATVSCVSVHADEVDLQPTVQVTASRVAETVDQTLADVSVITRADIDASVARDAYDLLRLEAGVDLYRTGGAGQQTSLFLRGSNSNQVLVLIDGVRTGAATTGAFAFEQLPLDAIERIEIVRGPRASYWGSDALGGVIQIFTRKLEGPRVALAWGSYDDADGSAGIGHWDGANGYSVQIGARHVGGFSATNPGICNGPDDPYCSYNADDDAYRNSNLAARAAHALGSQLLSASLYRSQGQSQFDQGYTDIIEQTEGINLEGPLGANWSHRLSLGHMREDLDTPTFGTTYQTRRTSLLWQNEFRLDANQRLTAGFDFVHDKGATLDTFAGAPRYRNTRHDSGVFAGWRATFGAFDSELSARHDHSSAFGGATTGSLAFGWRPNELLRAYASFGQGFRAPSMNDLYDPGYGGFYAGNPALEPEQSRSSEIGLELTPSDRQRFKMNVYSTRVNDLISFTGFQNQAINIAHAKLDGAELSYEARVGAWTARANYTWEDALDGDTGSRLLRRARNKAAAVVERSFGERFAAGAELQYAARRDDIGGIELPSYTLLNLRARCTLDDAWSVSGRIENLADRNYELVHGYNTAGRSAWLQLTWQSPAGAAR
jgi:vitamin B12 transporter